MENVIDVEFGVNLAVRQFERQCQLCIRHANNKYHQLSQGSFSRNFNVTAYYAKQCEELSLNAIYYW